MLPGESLMPDWMADFECIDCGAAWREFDPPEGFLDIPDELSRRKLVDEYIQKDHVHDCGMFGNGRARLTSLMRSAGSFGDPTLNPKEVPDGLVGN